MPTRRTPPAPPTPAALSVDQMRRGIGRLERAILELQNFDISQVTTRWSSEQKALEASIDGTLTSVFGHGTVEYKRYDAATVLETDIGMTLSQSTQRQEQQARDSMSKGIKRAIQLLQQATRWLSDEIEDQGATLPLPATQATAQDHGKPRKIFVVHGHDDGARETVARFIERLGFEPIILFEQANKGRTIIEKIEANSDVGFAVVLLTPDDEGSKKGGTPTPRARQNVLLELGYFMGSLGRPNVCALAAGSEMELPTDFAGVVWEALDAAGGWKQKLARELKAAGFEIDWNVVMG